MTFHGLLTAPDLRWPSLRYVIPEDQSFKKVAESLEMDPRALLRANSNRTDLKGLGLSSELMANTRLLIKPDEYLAEEYCMRAARTCLELSPELL